MSTLRELKQKYSFGAIPEWELVKAGLKPAADVAKAEEPKRKRRSEEKPQEPVIVDGDSD